MARRISSAVVVFGVCLCWFSTDLFPANPPAPQSAVPDSVFSQIDSIVKVLSEITGLPEEHPVPYGRMSKRQLRHFLARRIKKSIRPEEIRADELALKMFGFVPQNFDLRQSTMDLLTEQAAAFYDYDEKRLFLMQGASVPSDTMTLAHELSHALADQHFNLEDFMDEKPSNDDENLAHSAVVEGEASWLMIAYSLKETGQGPVPTPEMLRSITASSAVSPADFPVLAGAPVYIQQSLLFPYSQGTAFFDAVYHRIGKEAFTEVFENPPSASSQILHPGRYFAHRQPTKPSLPKVKGISGQDQVAEGSVGEFDHQMLLRQYVSAARAAELAPHLLGGEFSIDRLGKERRPVLRYVSEWDSPQNAATFFSDYPKILAGKWRRLDLTLNSPSALAGTGDRGMFVTRLSGKFVSSIEGLSDFAEWQRLETAH